MNIRKLGDTEIMKNAHGVDARNLYNTDDAMVTVITLTPGQKLKRHITPVDVAFYVLRRNGYCGGRRREGARSRRIH